MGSKLGGLAKTVFKDRSGLGIDFDEFDAVPIAQPPARMSQRVPLGQIKRPGIYSRRVAVYSRSISLL
eukprot:CAMPEP_0178631394 /NCGR_PEP_ID=MMETSP0698-20121128/10986_1 /TAXON_ID=265572 /ORGANISM="Extubocellulus spinifer, Strain CCMP396" /LENGTH=67 /DNA_ID=CAMNT_0020270817 /DNA_START=508 /DNA_END=711 /DNA_ORIENTATION=-